MHFSFNKKVYVFKPKLIPTIASSLALVILLSLSAWQLKRLAWKENLINLRIERFEGDSLILDEINNPSQNEFRKVSVSGMFLNNKEMYMPALSKRGNNGFHILVPLETKKGKMIIYDTGWVPTQKKEKIDRKNNIDNSFSIKEAVIRLPGRKGKFQPDNEPQNNFWFFVETKMMSSYLDLDLEQSYYLEAYDNGPNGFPMGNQTRIYIRNNHLQYAITWFLIACGLIGVYFAASIKTKKK